MKIDALTRKVDTLAVGKSINAANTLHGDSYFICASPMHLAQNCPSFSTFVESLMEQVNAFNDYRKQANGPFFETYNTRWRNHPNFSWKQNQPMNQGGAPHLAQNQYPPGFHNQGFSSTNTGIPTNHSSVSLFFTIHSGGISQGLHADYRPIS
jgi:hypothetical protein